MILVIECGLVLLAIGIGMFYPGLASRWFGRTERAIAHLARRRAISVIVVGCASLLVRVLLLPRFPVPVPAIHDEFSYLLMADTFAHGHLTNPTHPMWEHFETFHEIQQPTYASMYYPAQGVFLAFGQVALGHPYWGVWISAGLMSAAICWMLQGWVTPFWALIGGFFAVIRLGTVSYWANSYWGGAVTALGGALVLGATGRICRTWDTRNAMILGIGLGLVGTSRPFESMFFAFPVLIYIVIRMLRASCSRQRLATRVAAPLLLTLASFAGGMAFYFWRVTGSPLRPPFLVNLSTYNPIPYFPWQHIKSAVVYRHVQMEKFYQGWWQSYYDLGRYHPFVFLLIKAWTFAAFYLGPLLGIILLFGTFTIPYGASFRTFSRRTQFMLLLLLSVGIGAALPVFLNPHYIAAIACVIYLFVVRAMRRLGRWAPRGRQEGLAIVRLLCVTAVLVMIFHIVLPVGPVDGGIGIPTWCSPAVYDTPRREVEKKLLATDGKHLVIVHYEKDHSPIDEWVYNGADIDGSRIAWARDMGYEGNSELIRYFGDRKIWVAEPDHQSLSPYSPSSSSPK